MDVLVPHWMLVMLCLLPAGLAVMEKYKVAGALNMSRQN